MSSCDPFVAMEALCRPARFALMALGLLLSGGQAAWGACVMTQNYVEKSINMQMGNVIIPNGTAVGSLIKEATFPVPLTGNDKPWTCTGGGTVIGEVLQGTLVAGSDHIYTTSVTGVGIRLSRYFDATAETYYPHVLGTPGDFGNFASGAKFKVELFKVATVTGNGPLSQGTYTRYYSPADNKSVLTSILSGVGITIITPSCSVDVGSRNIAVDFGKVALNSFKGIGTTAGDRNFNIKLNCQAGQNAQNTIYLRMDAQRDPSTSQPGVLWITQGGTGIVAGGVGIQVLDKNANAVTFGTDALVGPSMDGSYVLPYTARYYQTENTVSAGRADGTATFTLGYK